METPSTPAADDLWPKVDPVASYRPSGGMLAVEIPGLSEAPLLTALARAIHVEMRAAGEWAARVGEPGDNGLPGPADFSRLRAETASRLLAIYTALHGLAHYTGGFDLAPEVLKASASRSYATAFHYAWASRPSLELP